MPHEKQKEQKFMVLGAGGFLGGHLVDLLEKQKKFEILSVTRGGINWKDDQKFDIVDKNSVFHYLEKFKPEIIVNLVAVSEHEKCESSKNFAFNVNVNGVLNILSGMEKFCPGAIFLNIGTIKELEPPESQNFYAVTKVCARNLIENFSNHGFKSVQCYLGNTSGPGQSVDFLLPKICRGLQKISELVKKNQKFEKLKLGNLDQKISVLNVLDAAAAILEIVENLKNLENLHNSRGLSNTEKINLDMKNGVYDIQSQFVYPITQIVEKVLEKLELPGEPKNYVQTDPKFYRPTHELKIWGNMSEKFKIDDTIEQILESE